MKNMGLLFEVFLILRLFLLPVQYVNYLTIGFAIISVLLFIMVAIRKKINVFNDAKIKWLVALTLVYGFIVVFSPHSFIYTSEVFATSLCAYIWIYYFDYKGASKFFRTIAFVSTIIQMGLCIIQGEVFSLLSVSEKSITSCVVFLMLCIEYKHRNYWAMLLYALGLVLSSFGSEFISNRTALLLLIVFAIVLVVQFFRKTEPKNLWIVQKSYRYFILSVIAIFIISFVWCAYAVAHGVSSYHGGLMDSSNFIRMNSNLYVLGQLHQDPLLLLFGYDTDIYEIMKLGVGAGFQYFNGLRVVQAHHSVLDVFQRCGLLFTIVYFMFIGKLIDDSKVAYKNDILLPIFAISMIMHSYLQNECLLMLMVTLNGTYAYQERRIYFSNGKIFINGKLDSS